MSRRGRVLWATVAILLLLVGVGALVVRRWPMWLANERVRLHLWKQGARSEFVMVDGNRIHYYEALPTARGAGRGGAGVPLVLVHGLGARSEDWSPMIPGLAAAGFHVYALDLLGYGRSARPDVDFGISTEEQAVAGFMRAVGLPKADVVGWSMGGWVAMKLALDHPEMVDRLVVYDTAGVYFRAGYDFSVFTPKDQAGVERLMRLLMPKPPRVPEFVMQDLVRSMQRNAWVVDRSVAEMTSGRELLDFRLHDLRLPLLIVWGEQDRLIPLSAGETIHRLVPGSVLAVAPGCGHLAPAECASPILRETVTFLRAEPPVRGGEATLPVAEVGFSPASIGRLLLAEDRHARARDR